MSKPVANKIKKSQTSTKVQSIVKNSTISSHQTNPRSAAEACMNSGSKYRQLPCKTFISVGTCPFGERCVFLHDPRLICPTAHSITRQKNKEDNAGDTLFWPVTSGEVSTRNLDHNFHPYSVPVPRNDQYKLHDQALYSLWMHYVEFCKNNLNNKPHRAGESSAGAEIYTPHDVPVNVFTHSRRLPVFQLLSSSNGDEILVEQFELATHKVTRRVQQQSQQQVPSLNLSEVMQQQPVKVNKLHLSPTSISATSHAREMPFTRPPSVDHYDDAHYSSGHTSHAHSYSTPPLEKSITAQQQVQMKYSAHNNSSSYSHDEDDLSSLSSGEEEYYHAASQQQDALHQQFVRSTPVAFKNARFQTSYPQPHQTQQYSRSHNQQPQYQEYAYGYESSMVPAW